MSTLPSVDIFDAAAAGDVEYLKKHIQSVNLKNERDWTPLHFAARYGRLEAAKLLKENNADLTAKDDKGRTASELAKAFGNQEVFQLLGGEQNTSTATLHGLPFPENYTSVFSGNPLNRFGWNRDKPEFLSKLAHSPRSKYLLLNGQKVLYGSNGDIHYVKYNEVASIVDRVYSQQNVHDPSADIILVFLGIDESQGQGEEGESLWALDLTPKGTHEKEFSELIQGFESNGLEFLPTLPRAFVMEKPISAIIAQAAAMVDWNTRNKYCPACGKRTLSNEAGYKRNCPREETEDEGCISHKGVQNFAYPRTDAVIIVCIIHPNGDKILLGRQKRWPRKMYSCISGFVEAAETLEEAVRREALEETGVVVDRVAYHSSQPWPFPNSLMLGFIAEAKYSDIKFSDDELEHAAWFSRSEVMAAVSNDPNATFSMAPKGSLASTLVHAWLFDKKWQVTNAKM
ncbi:MAG: NUDIX hydrolase domain-like protein [Benjaminiella poitrasii]|nr:MAG: NUDIX hydrolase domain-like protein [Benjaminiella poitrasii]